MSTTGVSGSSPISFTDGNGNQLVLPLSALSIGPNGVVVTGWAPYTTNKPSVDSLLTQLYASGILTAAPAPASTRAMFVQAATAGSTSNNITINVVSPSASSTDPTTFDVTVTETDIYGGLSTVAPTSSVPSPNFIGSVLGDGNTVVPSRPGLLVLPTQTGVVLPASTPAGQTLPVSSTPPAAATVAVPKNSGTGNAFTLQAKAGLPAATTFTATISDVNPTANTFSLTVVWSLKVTGVKVGTLQSSFASELVVLPSVDNPSGILQPATATVTLSGGQDGATPASYASATLLAL